MLGRGAARTSIWLGLAGLSLVIVSAARAGSDDQPKQEPRASLGVRITQLRSNDGKVGCRLFDGPEGFPTRGDRARQQRWCRIDERAATCQFAPIPRGTYAVACIHDENDNGKLDTNWIGIPEEGTVASNHARGTLGPPSYEDAKFRFDARPKTLALRMGY